MVSVDERIWTSWREQAAEEDEWRVRMRLDSPAAAEVVIDTVRRWMARPGDAGRGEWETVLIPGGLLISVAESNDLPGGLTSLSEALEQAGITGTLTLWEQPPTPRLPREAPLLAAVLSVDGDRVQRRPRSYRWDPDPAAHAEVLSACVQWCRSIGDQGAVALLAGTIGPILVAPDEPLVGRLTELFEAHEQSELTAVGDGEFRVASVLPYSGRVLLLVGHDGPDDAWWPSALAGLASLLRSHASALVYARVHRGWDISGALIGDRLTRDWPARARYQPRGIGFSRSSFDDRFVPDAFGLQLLGPALADRVDPGPGWDVQRLPSGRILVEHVDRDAWFAAPFVEPPGTSGGAAVPAILRDARQALAPILYEPGALARAGFQDMADS